MSSFTRRAFVPERMDDPDADPAEIEEALRFIRRVNARLGGAEALLGHLRRWVRGWPAERELRLLDLGTGSADIPCAVARWAAAAGRSLRIVAVDNHAVTLAAARRHLAGQGGLAERIELVEADVRDLARRYGPASFDVVHAGMFLHHLPDIEAVTTLRLMQRLAAVSLVWNDLIRDLPSRIAVRLLTLGVPEPVRHDAVVSVAKGFTRGEALDLARRAGLERPVFHRHLFGRFTLVAPGR